MRHHIRTRWTPCLIAALAIALAGNLGCDLDNAVVDGVEGGVTDAVSAAVSDVVLGLLGIE